VTQANHQIVRDFFTHLAGGTLTEDMLTPDMTTWTVLSGPADKATFLMGVKFLASLFASDFSYTINALTAQDDRVVAETQSNGTFLDGEPFHNVHVFLFRIRDGKIAYMGEFMNQTNVMEKIMPRLQAAMAQGANA
jgi:ketosteroid isomerase-like protein